MTSKARTTEEIVTTFQKQNRHQKSTEGWTVTLQEYMVLQTGNRRMNMFMCIFMKYNY